MTETEAIAERLLDGTPPSFKVVGLEAFMQMDIPPRSYILDPILPEKGLGMLVAGRGIGKTFIALGCSTAISSAGSFLRWHAPQPRKVLHVDGEMPAQALQERLQAMLKAEDQLPPAPGHLRLLAMDMQEIGASLNLAMPAHQRRGDGLPLVIGVAPDGWPVRLEGGRVTA